jgi:hypothetical protein
MSRAIRALLRLSKPAWSSSTSIGWKGVCSQRHLLAIFNPNELWPGLTSNRKSDVFCLQ